MDPYSILPVIGRPVYIDMKSDTVTSRRGTCGGVGGGGFSKDGDERKRVKVSTGEHC